MIAKVSPGQPLRIPADTFNAFVDAAVAYQASRLGRSAPGMDTALATGVILVRNDSGAARDRFDVLALDAPLILPSASLAGFHAQVLLRGMAPDTAHAGRFAVLQEPLPAGALGRALVAGVTPARLDVQADTDAYADLASGVTATLRTGSTGAARILWKESGTGLKQAVVLLAGAVPASGGGVTLAGKWLTTLTGAGTYTIPTNPRVRTRLLCLLMGGGGGGGGATPSYRLVATGPLYGRFGGSGGSSGGVTSVFLDVVGLTSLTYACGAGGAASTTTGNGAGQPGGATTLSDGSRTVSAPGGGGGFDGVVGSSSGSYTRGGGMPVNDSPVGNLWADAPRVLALEYLVGTPGGDGRQALASIPIDAGADIGGRGGSPPILNNSGAGFGLFGIGGNGSSGLLPTAGKPGGIIILEPSG